MDFLILRNAINCSLFTPLNLKAIKNKNNSVKELHDHSRHAEGVITVATHQRKENLSPPSPSVMLLVVSHTVSQSLSHAPSARCTSRKRSDFGLDVFHLEV